MSFIDGITTFFRKKSKLRVIFIDEVGNVSNKIVKYANNTFEVKIQGEKQAYLVDHNFIMYDKGDRTATSFYYVNNPQPIHIQHSRNKDGIDSIGFKKILDSKTIQDLFSSEGMNIMKVIMFLAIGILLLQLIGLLVQFGVIKVASGG